MTIQSDHQRVLRDSATLLSLIAAGVKQPEGDHRAIVEQSASLIERARSLESQIHRPFRLKKPYSPVLGLRIVESVSISDYASAATYARELFDFWNSLEYVHDVLEPKVYETWPGFLDSLGIQLDA